LGVKRIIVTAVAIAAAAALAHLLSGYSIEIAWLVALAIPLAALARIIIDLSGFQPPSVRHASSKPLIRVLSDIVAGLPETENSLKLRLRELLIRRLAARTGSPAAEVEARVHELVKDEQLVRLLRGEVRLRNERDVLDLLERIDRL